MLLSDKIDFITKHIITSKKNNAPLKYNNYGSVFNNIASEYIKYILID